MVQSENILEVGAEGGSVSFLRSFGSKEDEFSIQAEGVASSKSEKFDTLDNAITSFTDRNNSLLHFYPVYVHPDYKLQVLNRIKKEIAATDYDILERFPNKPEWERILETNVEKGNSAIQHFAITRLRKVETYCYERYADEKELQKVITTFGNDPNAKITQKGTGRIRGNVFIVEDQRGKIKGVYPLDQYFIQINPKNN
jgi:hypothetical protein